MAEEEKKSSTNATVQWCIDLTRKKLDHDENAKKFIKILSSLTDDLIRHNNENIILSEMKALKVLFDSFAIIDEFNSSLIIDCYYEIKISLMKWKRFADKASSVATEFKTILEQMYEVMNDLYHYEHFGFFSTNIHPKSIPELNLPCHVFCGCTNFWPREPYLTEEGKVAYENVVRFRDPGNEKYLCITISKNPRLLEPREECSLTDEQLDSIKNFVINNQDIIILHAMDYLALDSCDLFDALELKNRAETKKATYRVAYIYKIHSGQEVIRSNTRYVDMNDRSYKEAVSLYKDTIKELKASFGPELDEYTLKNIKRARKSSARSEFSKDATEINSESFVKSANKLRAKMKENKEVNKENYYVISGVLRGLKTVKSQRGRFTMAFGKIQDEHGAVDLTFFPKAWGSLYSKISDGEVVSIKGCIDVTPDTPSFIVHDVENYPAGYSNVAYELTSLRILKSKKD